MQSDLRNSMLAPIKALTYCVTGQNPQSNQTKRRFRRRSNGRSDTSGLTRPQTSYRVDLERERKAREALNAQKNAQRAAMRTHFRRKYQLNDQDMKDRDHIRAVGGKVSLPAQLAKMIPGSEVKDDGLGLLNAFQGLRFSGGIYTDNKQTKPSRELCKLM